MNKTEETQQKEMIISGIRYRHISEDRMRILRPCLGNLEWLIGHMECLEYDKVEKMLLTLTLRTLRMVRRIFHLALTDEWDKMERVFAYSVHPRRCVLSTEKCALAGVDTNYNVKNSIYEFAYVDPRQSNQRKVLSDKTQFLKHFWRENNPYQFEYGVKLRGYHTD